ncbi:hypothetical protein EA772_01105 [Pedobacter sp. G11]|uniref:hypothetical protein n=1 Tax=Pedobacter sp. G11 TaxID=2482728 RepID=UPI000F5E85A9|nr:hypothetical protein [Pedobacter sp. G11]AZI24007.1 hypothetical protein EA772_01105 [Pedobacter sp. G11]
MIKSSSRFTLTVLILGFFLATSCNRVNNDHHIVLLLEKEVSRNIGGKIELGKLINFKWDKLLILPPYTNISRVEKAHHISLNPIKHSRIDIREDINQIVFFEENKIIKMIEFPRSSGDFENAHQSELFTRANANFKIFATNPPQNTPNSKPWIILKKDQ